MKIKLKVEWPNKTHWQILASYRDDLDPMSNAGWYIGIMGDEIVLGQGHAFSEGYMKFFAANRKSDIIIIEEYEKSLSYAWSEEPQDMLGTMMTNGPGNLLYVGKDPQQPVANWTGKVELIEEDYY